MSEKYKTVLSWSGGKDSAIVLQRLLNDSKVSIERLLVTTIESTDRVSMHGVRNELIKNQAESLGISVSFIAVPKQPPMQEYDRIMDKALKNLMDEGFTHCAFGDIFLEDLRRYREKNLSRIGMNGLFPIWQEDSALLARSFLRDGFKAIIVCVDQQTSVSGCAGMYYSQEFLEKIDGDIDLCGENGEFHTFVFDGPFFTSPVAFEVGELSEKIYPSPVGGSDMEFQFCELLPA